MKRNDKYKQIWVEKYRGRNKDNYDALKGKVVDKVAFLNSGQYYDENMLLIMFTDNTFICIGQEFVPGDDIYRMNDNDLPTLSPKNINGGNYDCHIWVDDKGEVRFDTWIDILRDFGIWELDIKEAQEIIERDKKKKEEREYEEYLKLKEKFKDRN